MRAFVINLEGRPDRLEAFRRQEFPFKVERIQAIKSRIGEDGCTQSHLLALRSITEFPTVVFEDDAVLKYPWHTDYPDLFWSVEKIMKQLPDDYDGFWLGANLQSPLKRYSDNLFHLYGAYCLHAVVYNSQAMVDYVLQNHDTPSGRNLDIFYHNEVFKRFKCFISSPQLCVQSAGVSNICGDWTNYAPELEERFTLMTKEL
jgi:GR25 family glycosyltransferase involved in LPS biosynthesis